MKKASSAAQLKDFQVIGQTVQTGAPKDTGSPGRRPNSPKAKNTPKRRPSVKDVGSHPEDPDVPTEAEISSSMTTVKNLATKLEQNVEIVGQKVKVGDFWVFK